MSWKLSARIPTAPHLGKYEWFITDHINSDSSVEVYFWGRQLQDMGAGGSANLLFSQMFP